MPSSKTYKAIPPSGTSKQPALPRLLPYPKFLPFESTPAIHDIYCYVMEHYGITGLTVLVYREPAKDQVTVLCGDWEGNKFDLTESSPQTDMAFDFLQKDGETLIGFMQVIKLMQAQCFFVPTTAGFMLVDVQTAINKLVSPGTVEEVFGKHFATPVIRKKEIMDERAREALLTGTGSYVGDMILKPSRYRDYHDQPSNTYQPMYVELRR